MDTIKDISISEYGEKVNDILQINVYFIVKYFVDLWISHVWLEYDVILMFKKNQYIYEL